MSLVPRCEPRTHALEQGPNRSWTIAARKHFVNLRRRESNIMASRERTLHTLIKIHPPICASNTRAGHGQGPRIVDGAIELTQREIIWVSMTALSSHTSFKPHIYQLVSSLWVSSNSRLTTNRGLDVTRPRIYGIRAMMSLSVLAFAQMRRRRCLVALYHVS